MHEQLILDLFDKQMIQFGEFTFKSGHTAYNYVDIRSAIAYPALFKQICDSFFEVMKPLKYDLICGVPYSALAFASAIAYGYQIPMLLKRKEAKGYATKKILEGHYLPSQKCVVIEDVITTGSSVFEDTVKVIEEHGLVVTDIITLVDRNQGGTEKIEKQGYKVHSIISLKDIIEILYRHNRISKLDKERAFEKRNV